ncbi:MAG TPA: hypothetical protein VN982_01685 [Candidatus Dormibacteraeota bacterium]|nr:hypothetical protein [Candidatus Dormibacteraeota bacterium]
MNGCTHCAGTLRSLDRAVTAIRTLSDLEQKILRAQLVEESAATILEYWGVPARPESIQ